MTSPRPFVSVVVPTRNRPGLLRHCLESLRAQSFDDFEVIVSDNHTGESSRHVFDQYAGPNFTYIQPERPLSMCDNWEFACAQARGQYVTVLIDKTVLLPSALERLHEICQRKSYEVVSWRNEGYDDVPDSPTYKVYFPDRYGREEPKEFDAISELHRRFSFDLRRGTEGYHYFWGKICFGAYHESLISRIKSAHGRLFFPFSPDYTSMVLALGTARSAIDLGVPLLISAETTVSNGKACAQDERAMRSFLKASDPTDAVMHELPLKGLYASVHNLVARDYVAMQAELGSIGRQFHLDSGNLLLRCLEDLNEVQFSDPVEKQSQYAILRSEFNGLSRRDQAEVITGYIRHLVTATGASKAKALLSSRFPKIVLKAQELRQKTNGHSPRTMERFESINAAAAAANGSYLGPRLTSASNLAAH